MTVLWRHHAQTVLDVAGLKKDYIAQVQGIFHLNGYQNWFKRYGNFTELMEFAYWWGCIRKGQRAAFEESLFLLHTELLLPLPKLSNL